MQSLGEIELRAPGVGAKIGICLFVTLGLPARGGHIVQTRCVTVYMSILIRFSALFQNKLRFPMQHIVIIFVARWRHNFLEISKIVKSPKIGGKVCAQLRTTVRFEENSTAVV